MEYPIIDNFIYAYLRNGWTGLDIPATITYEPVQLGSGDPSPDNIRPIYPAITIDIGGNNVSVYGGTLNINNRMLTINKDITIINDTSRLDYIASNPDRFGGVITPIRPYVITTLCYKITHSNIFSYVIEPVGNSANLLNNTGTWYSTYNNLRIRYDNYTQNEFYNLVTSNSIQLVGELMNPVTYSLTFEELSSAIKMEDDIKHRLKLPLPHYFPHPVIDALQRASAGTQTADDTEVLRHYLTPLGIGGI